MVHVSSVCIFDCKWYVTILTTLKQFVSKSVKFVSTFMWPTVSQNILYMEDFSRVLSSFVEFRRDLRIFVDIRGYSRIFEDIRGDSRIFAEFRGVSSNFEEFPHFLCSFIAVC